MPWDVGGPNENLVGVLRATDIYLDQDGNTVVKTDWTLPGVRG